MLSDSRPLYSAFDCALSRTFRMASAAFFGYLPGPTFGFGLRKYLNLVYGTGLFRSATSLRYFLASSTFIPTSILHTSRACFGETLNSTPMAFEVFSGSDSCVYPIVSTSSLQRHELRGPGSADSQTAVPHGLPSHRELSERMANHLGLDFDCGELLAVVHMDGLPDELGNDRYLAPVCPHGLARSPEPPDERLLLGVQSSDVSPARSRGQELDNICERQLQKLFHIVTPVGELLLPACLDLALLLPHLPSGGLRGSNMPRGRLHLLLGRGCSSRRTRCRCGRGSSSWSSRLSAGSWLSANNR